MPIIDEIHSLLAGTFRKQHHSERDSLSRQRLANPAGVVRSQKPDPVLKSGTCDALSYSAKTRVTPCEKGEFMVDSILALISALRVFFRSRRDTALESPPSDSRPRCSGINDSLAR
jgi:hypothetical protein